MRFLAEQVFDRIPEDCRTSIVLFSIIILHNPLAIVKLYTRPSMEIHQKSVIRLPFRIAGPEQRDNGNETIDKKWPLKVTAKD